ncbi:MAG: DUF1553 domain-containing protein [Bryobacteraceae bacterium]
MTRTALVAWIVACSAGRCIAADLNRDAGDILSTRCLSCHGPSVKMAGLDLSSRAAAVKGGRQGSALNTTNPKDSRLLQRVIRNQMPPAGPLSAAEKDTLTHWVESGAVWGDNVGERRAGPQWWSLQPLRTVAPPAVASIPDGWAQSPIDRFILTKLRQSGLEPSKPATARELIRRVTFDVTGLPPTPAEVEAFVKDPSPAAYEKLVDRLLASPRYGERWGRHWLDVARFSESEGFERDLVREHAWRYRDYVIRSLNQDKPYIDFAREQLAGDVLDQVTHESIAATGFLVAGPTDAVGLTSAVPREREAVREDQLEEMVSVVSQTFLGLTTNCARCHDHKFDPIPQKDYYRFKAAFAGVWQPVQDRESIELLPDGRALRTPQEQTAFDTSTASLRDRIETIEAELARLYRNARAKILERRGYRWPATVPQPASQWNFDADARDQIGSLHGLIAGNAEVADGCLKPLGNKEGVRVRTAKLDREIKEKTLEAWIRVRKKPEKGTTILVLQNNSGYRGAAFDGIQYNGPKKMWENSSTAGFRNTQWDAPEENAEPGDQLQIAITYAADGTITAYRNGKQHGKPFHGEAGNASSELQTYLPQDAIAVLTTNQSLNLDEARIYAAALTAQQIADSYHAGAPSVPREESTAAMTSQDRDRVSKLDGELAALRTSQAEQAKPDKAFAADVLPPGVTHLLRRGDVTMKGEALAPAGLSAIRGLSPELNLSVDARDQDRRRKMAEWIANPANPLFSRVIVNRLWHGHFGAGIVESPNDFGYNGGQPSHADLLDFLAADLIQNGWSLKSLHKRILLSATYRQSSEHNPQAAAKDADNRLLWRFTPRRLEGESVRDAMLFISGALNPAMGGPSFRPFKATTPGGSYVKYEPLDSAEPELQRRTIYRMNVTTGGDPMLDALDCPLPAVKTPRRASTTTALQALSLMNGAFATRTAKTFAERLGKEADGTDAQITLAFRLALGRAPSEAELTRSRALVARTKLETLCWGLFNATEFLQVE